MLLCERESFSFNFILKPNKHRFYVINQLYLKRTCNQTHTVLVALENQCNMFFSNLKEKKKILH